MRRLPILPTEPSTAPALDVQPRLFVASPLKRWSGREILASPETARVLHSAWSGDPAVVVPSPPGAGKTRLVALLAAALAEGAGMRIGIAAQTREQACEIARRLVPLTSLSALIWPTSQPLPTLPGVRVVQKSGVRFPTEGGGVLIATTARWLYSRPHELGCDLLLIDEAWQATYADLGALGAFAAQVVCVGDPGQIAPVVTGRTDRWRNQPSAPNLPAPTALAEVHNEAVTTIALRHTWRLGPETTALIQPAFYPALPFTSRRPPEHIESQAGESLAEISNQLVKVSGGSGDPILTGRCAERVRELIGHRLQTEAGNRTMTAYDVAVVCAHVGQAAAVRAALADEPHVLVGTANQLQGLERPAVVVLHPLAGVREVSAFTADVGRACVMLSRHRSHVSVVMDETTPEVLAAADPDVPGVVAHQTLTASLLDRL